MGQLHPLESNSALESTIDKILNNTEQDILSNIKSGLDESQQKLDDSIPKLESEYDKIISDGKKEADKIEKQITGSSDIEARNKQLMALEDAVDKVFSTALDQIANADRSGDYSNLIKTLIEEATKILGTSENYYFYKCKRTKMLSSLHYLNFQEQNYHLRQLIVLEELKSNLKMVQ